MKRVLAVGKCRWHIRQQLQTRFIVRVISKRVIMFLHLQRQTRKKKKEKEKKLSYASLRNTIMMITNNLFCGFGEEDVYLKLKTELNASDNVHANRATTQNCQRRRTV